MPEQPKVAPVPRRNDVFGNIDQTQSRVIDGRKNRPKKVEELFNTRCRVGLKDDIDQERRELGAELGRNITRGEMIDMLLAAYREKTSDSGFVELLDAAKEEQPSAQDEAFGRTIKMTFWANADQNHVLKHNMQTHNWSLSDVINDNMVKAAKYMKLNLE